tara:strand:+ start:2739 stop:3035 length:297 start_codon:yes stop_codon:yes gene_type:complete
MTEKLKPLNDDELNKIIKDTRRTLRFAKDFARALEIAYEKFCELQVHHMHAVSHEREECAKIADEFAGDCWIGDADWEAATRIAALIRAKGIKNDKNK